jgi:5-methyltetrahydrofolate--homocysteine methyltransferase
MALTRQRKLAIARRSHELLARKYGIQEEDLYFDCLVFPAATGDGKYYGSAIETIAALRLIKDALPGCKTVLGVSNVSFGLPPAGREVLNAVFLHRCVGAGLDLAIANTEKLARYPDIPAHERLLCENILDWKGPGDPAFPAGFDAVAEFVTHFRQAKPKASAASPQLPAEERVRLAVVSASREGLPAALEELLEKKAPLDIINGPLMTGMAEVGRLFAANELIVAEVLQCAEVMKAAVSFLEPHLAGSRAASRGTIALATVKGDVHDIGKNLVHIILKNNGYEVVDLGIKAGSEAILDGLRRSKAQALGLSGLLVRSCQEMALAAEDLAHAGVNVPIVAGGAALSPRFVAAKIAPRCAGPVFYAKDAMVGLSIFNELFDPQKRAACDRLNREEQEKLRSSTVPAASPRPAAQSRPLATALRHDGPIPPPPDLDLHVTDDFDSDEVFRNIDLQMLYGKHLGLKGAVKKLFADKDPKAVDLRRRMEELWGEARSRGFLKPRAAYRFCPCQAEGDSLILYSSPEGPQPLVRFDFPRQASGDRLCLADFVAPKSSGRMDFVGLFVVTSGAGIREETARLRDSGDYLKSHALSSLALNGAEAAAEVLHQRLRTLWDIGPRGERFSFGYPACPDLEPQARLLDLLDSKRTVGVALTEGFMMDPEASVSALVFHHPKARIFSVTAA